MLKVESVLGFAERPGYKGKRTAQVAVNARRGGLVHGTKVATKGGWKLVEEIQTGDRIRTLDNGFQPVRRISTDCIKIPPGVSNTENLPIRVPSNTAFNGRPVWLMPEQGVALDSAKLGPTAFDGPRNQPIVPARLLSGVFRIKSDAPASFFDISTLFFDDDEVIYIEGGFRAFCPSGRFGGNRTGAQSYVVAESEAASNLICLAERRGDIGVLANSLGAVPAPIFDHPIVPVRPVRGTRRPGRPGRPVMTI